MISRPALMPDSIDLFATCPESTSAAPEYRSRVIETARWAEDCGCKGILVYSDNRLVDPWLVAQIIVENTAWISPLVAVQPVYMHPYSIAKMVSSLACLHGRRVFLNMIAGGFKNDLLALDDSTPHDRRYDRLVEYTSIILELVRTSGPLSYRGEFYKTENLRLTPPVPIVLQPDLMISGSSEAGERAARTLGAICVHYPGPADECPPAPLDNKRRLGIRIGLIARPTDREAWDEAHKRFPEDRRGRLLHQYAMKISDSRWHRQLSDAGVAAARAHTPYWLGPFENYKTFCPYLVGGYEVVATEISRYIERGYRSFILDIPPDRSDLMHSAIAFERAVQLSSVT